MTKYVYVKDTNCYYSFKEIAKVLGTSPAEVRRIYDAAMEKLVKDPRFQAYFYGDNLLY